MNRWIGAVETGDPNGDYSCVTILHDGPNCIPQVTYGVYQTTEYGNLPALLASYCQQSGSLLAHQIGGYLPQLGKSGNSLWESTPFLALLRQAGQDPVMQALQDSFFEEEYWRPMANWANGHGFTFPLSWLVLYDSFIQSGGILMKLRNQFPAATPAAGGDEKTWIGQYLVTRSNWLISSPNEAVHNSAYRVADLLRLFNQDNWFLTEAPIVANDCTIL